jgi:ubiquinone/menaquinone biosynthesis C-methylase UbiE
MSFDTLAPHYRWLETALAGRVLQRARLHHLPSLQHATHALLVGEGPGRFLQALRAARPDLPVTVVDVSAGMLAQARRADPRGPTTFVRADLRTWEPPPGAFDAIVTSCVLDCFNADSLEKVVSRLARAATFDACWLLTDFAVPAQGWRRWRARRVHGLMYRSFRIVTRLEARELTPPDPFLRAAEFELIDRSTFNHGLLHADLWQRRPSAGGQSRAEIN